jgi:hypothetical protein
MAINKNEPQAATGPLPGDFTLGSAESRAAARMLSENSGSGGACVYFRVSKTREEYKKWEADVKAGKVFRYTMLPGKSASSEDWVRECQEDAEELERENAAKKAAREVNG